MGKKLIRFDWAMKTLLRDKANFDVLEGFLAALLEDDGIRILRIIESETNQLHETDKFNRVDLLIEDSQQRKIFIEIQNTREADYLESLLYASSKIVVENQDLGEDFRDISKVISISILYFNLGTGDDYIYYGTTEFRGINTGHPLVVKKRVEVMESIEPRYRFVEKNIFPEYYLITVERYKNIIQRRIDEWIYIFKNNEVAAGSSSKNIDKAEKKLAEMNMTEAQRKAYDRFLINMAKDRDAVATAENEGFDKGWKKGNKIGIEKGEKIGIEKGEKIGIEKGEKIGIEKGGKLQSQKIAREMLAEGELNDRIKKYTGLSDEEIDKLKDTNH